MGTLLKSSTTFVPPQSFRRPKYYPALLYYPMVPSNRDFEAWGPKSQLQLGEQGGEAYITLYKDLRA